MCEEEQEKGCAGIKGGEEWMRGRGKSMKIEVEVKKEQVGGWVAGGVMMN